MNLDLIDKLTEGGKYVPEMALLLLLNDNDYMLECFDRYNITGKKLETFLYKCCNNADMDTIRTVLLCLDWELFDINLVHENLEQSSPIPFIEDLSLPNEGHLQRFKRYKETFRFIK